MMSFEAILGDLSEDDEEGDEKEQNDEISMARPLIDNDIVIDVPVMELFSGTRTRDMKILFI